MILWANTMAYQYDMSNMIHVDIKFPLIKQFDINSLKEHN